MTYTRSIERIIYEYHNGMSDDESADYIINNNDICDLGDAIAAALQQAREEGYVIGYLEGSNERPEND